jgi:hypothetical protein
MHFLDERKQNLGLPVRKWRPQLPHRDGSIEGAEAICYTDKLHAAQNRPGLDIQRYGQLGRFEHERLRLDCETQKEGNLGPGTTCSLLDPKVDRSPAAEQQEIASR